MEKFISLIRERINLLLNGMPLQTWLYVNAFGTWAAFIRFLDTLWRVSGKIALILICTVMLVLIVLTITARSQPPRECPNGYIWFASPGACIPGFYPTREVKE